MKITLNSIEYKLYCLINADIIHISPDKQYISTISTNGNIIDYIVLDHNAIGTFFKQNQYKSIKIVYANILAPFLAQNCLLPPTTTDIAIIVFTNGSYILFAYA